MFNRRTLLHGGASSLLTLATAGASNLPQFAPRSSGTASFDHDGFGRLLSRYVKPSRDGVNRVDYRAWKASGPDLAALADYLRRLQAQDPATLLKAEQFAYWANLYNAETLRVVLAAYPVRTILLIRPTLLSIGPWKAKTLSVAGTRLSLDEVENAILRPLFRDARVHYSLNCASTSCPNLRTSPWRGSSLNSDLDAAAVAYVNHPRGVSVERRGLRLSSIYKWYHSDFGNSDAGVFAHLRRYAQADLRADLDSSPSIAGYAYDWSLNDAGHVS